MYVHKLNLAVNEMSQCPHTYISEPQAWALSVKNYFDVNTFWNDQIDSPGVEEGLGKNLTWILLSIRLLQ